MPVSSKEFLDTQANIECRFTLKRVRDMIRTYSQLCYFLKLTSLLLMIFHVNTCLECLQELSCFNFTWLIGKLLCVRWNLPSETGSNEKKIKFSHDSKITVQVFNTLSSKFPQIITSLTEDTELAFTERLERLYLIVILLIALLSHIFVVKFSYECSLSFPKFFFPFKSSFICN